MSTSDEAGLQGPQDGAAASAVKRGQISWAMFEFARNPYVLLITIYIFAPYFANEVVGDVARGQSLWARMNWIGAFFIAVLAPFLGAIADSLGHRKPWIMAFVALMVPACFLLWFAIPGSGLGIFWIAVLVVLCNVSMEFSSVFHNSMLPSIASDRRMAQLSGLGLALGNGGGLIILVVMLYGTALPGVVDWSFIPAEPWFGLDRAMHEPARLSGPVGAIWLLLFSVPLFLYTPDQKRTDVPMGAAVRASWASIKGTIDKLKLHKNIALYLLARMLYNDGKTAILVVGGVYASGVFGWGFLDMLIYGIVLTIFAVSGGFLGGWLDNRFGSRNAILISIGGTMLGMALALSITPTTILFFIPFDPATAAPVWDLPFFNTWPEVLYLGVVILVAIFITAAYANSRTMLARLAPKEMVTEFFGLYALSGTATAFVGTALVDLTTTIFNSPRIGFSSVFILLISGFILMFWVKDAGAPAKQVPKDE